jgi:hypothetical protein
MFILLLTRLEFVDEITVFMKVKCHGFVCIFLYLHVHGESMINFKLESAFKFFSITLGVFEHQCFIVNLSNSSLIHKHLIMVIVFNDSFFNLLHLLFNYRFLFVVKSAELVDFGFLEQELLFCSIVDVVQNFDVSALWLVLLLCIKSIYIVHYQYKLKELNNN